MVNVAVQHINPQNYEFDTNLDSFWTLFYIPLAPKPMAAETNVGSITNKFSRYTDIE